MMDLWSMMAGQAAPSAAYTNMARGTASLLGNSEAAYQQGAIKEATLQDKLLDARKKRDEEIARAGREDAMVAAGFTPQQAKLVDLVMESGGGNYSQVMQGEGYRQEQGFRNDAVTAARARDDITDYNAPLMGLENGPVETAKVQDGNLLTGFFGDDPTAVPTKQGRAKIEADQAMAAQRRASGEAALIRANKPPASRSSGSRSADGDVLQQARERVASGADPKTVAEYLRRKGYPTVADKIYRAPKK